ncbi:TIGR02147 family protein [Bdellovibrio sp. HCB290]|uniref:TIGR02147 family protein n=1 Tax=Bdellovibrio sp. HCB290 TaxID=3394356 RepID=UPI0039B6D611
MSSQKLGSVELVRPVVFDYGTPAKFLRALFEYYKKTGSFSLRQRTQRTGGLSQTLVSQIINGHRQVTRDNLPCLALVFKLTKIEQDYLDKQLLGNVLKVVANAPEQKESSKREAKNHILSDWIHPYVKDLVNIKGFSPEPQHLHRMLSGIATPDKIKKSVDFLIREGFWRRTPEGKIVPEDHTVTTTNEIPNDNIRSFHKKALDIAQRGISALPSHRRKSSTVLVSVDKNKMDELRGLVDSFQQQLLDFIEKNPQGKDSLVQVAIHLTPVGAIYEESET